MNLSNEKTTSAPLFAIWSAMISVYIIWGSTFLAIRFAIETIPHFLMAAFRFLITGGTLYLIRRSRGDTASSFSAWCSAVIIGILVGGWQWQCCVGRTMGGVGCGGTACGHRSSLDGLD